MRAIANCILLNDSRPTFSFIQDSLTLFFLVLISNVVHYDSFYTINHTSRSEESRTLYPCPQNTYVKLLHHRPITGNGFLLAEIAIVLSRYLWIRTKIFTL